MKKVVAWAGRAVVLPLVPAVVGALMRALFSNEWGITAIEPGELAFSIALMALLALGGASRLDDRELRDALWPLFTMIATIAMCLFAGSLLVSVLAAQVQKELIIAASAGLAGGPAELVAKLANYSEILQRIRLFSIGGAILSIGVTGLATHKYGLDDAQTLGAAKDKGGS